MSDYIHEDACVEQACDIDMDFNDTISMIDLCVCYIMHNANPDTDIGYIDQLVRFC